MLYLLCRFYLRIGVSQKKAFANRLEFRQCFFRQLVVRHIPISLIDKNAWDIQLL